MILKVTKKQTFTPSSDGIIFHYQVKGITPDICFLVFAHVHHVRQNFGTRTSSRTTILW